MKLHPKISQEPFSPSAIKLQPTFFGKQLQVHFIRCDSSKIYVVPKISQNSQSSLPVMLHLKIFAILAIVCCVAAKDFAIGVKADHDQLMVDISIDRANKFFRKTIVEKQFGQRNMIITRIEVKEMGPEEFASDVELKDGGVLQEFAVLRIKSQRGKEIHLSVKIWGRP